MVVQNIFILSLLITNVLSAPSNCIESCDSYIKQYQTQTSGSFQNHFSLSQSGSHLQGLDYSKPGTWSEHNDYDTDNGHGKVHEERGQYVEGPKTVRYYKKNYTSSHNTNYPNGEELLRLEHQNNKYNTHIPTQNSYNKLGNTESVAQQYKYNRTQNQQYTQSLHRQSKTQSERLEDLGEYSGGTLQTNAQSASVLTTQNSQEPYHINTQPENWSRSYETDGGHGRVFEEQGHYVSGDKNVRYYKRNYTSNYSSSDGTPIPETIKTGMQDIQSEIEKLHTEFGKEYNHISTAKSIGSSNIAQTRVNTHGLSTSSIYNINNNNYKDQNDRNILSATNRNEEQHTSVKTNQHLPYSNPYQNSYGTNSYSTYEKHGGYATKFQPTSQLINPTSYTTNVLTTGDSDYKKNIFSESTSQHLTDNLETEILDEHQSKLVRNQMFLDNLRNNGQRQDRLIQSGPPGHKTYYKEHWTSSHTKEASVPHHSIDISHINQHSLPYNNNQYENSHNLHQGIQQETSNLYKFEENGYNNIRKKPLGKLIFGTSEEQISGGADVVDCTHNSQQSYGSSQKQTRYKRNVNYDKQEGVQQRESKLFNNDYTQETLQSPYLTQQTSKIQKLQQNLEQSYQTWKPGSANQQLEDLTQKTDGSDDLTQQTAGKLEFGPETQQSYQPWKSETANERLEDLTQKTDGSDDLTQQTAGNLEFGQESQQSNQPWKRASYNQRLEDLMQTTHGSDDLRQQTDGNLEFGQESQQSYQPWKPEIANERLEDLTQKADGSDDLTEQTAGKLEFGQESQQSYQPGKPESSTQQLEDLMQKTDGFDDLTQQTAGKLEFGQESQQSYQPWKPESANERLEDLTQKTDGPDNLTQQTAGNLESDQESQQFYQPWKPESSTQQLEDLTQKTDGSDDLTQQTASKLEFGQESQQSYQPSKPESAHERLQELTQKTDEFEGLTQQSTGNLESVQESQQSYQPWKLGRANDRLEDLTQKTDGSDDLTQQTAGKLEFGQESQQSYQPSKPESAHERLHELTQKTDEFEDLTQQSTGNLESDQESQQSYQPWKLGRANDRSEDLTQKTDGFGDLTQQTTGNLESDQESQQSYQPWKPESANQQLEDLTQKTDGFHDFTQQSAGKLAFGLESQQSYQPWKPGSANQQLEDLTQKTDGFDDLTRQTTGNLESDQESQQSYQPWKAGSSNQRLEDLMQTTHRSDDLTQQTAGNLEFGQESQQSYQPWKSETANERLEDLTQKTDGSDDITQQTAGKLQFSQESQQSYQPWKPESANQQLEDSTQKTDGFDDLTQQSAGKLAFGLESQQSYQPWKLESANERIEDFIQKTDRSDDITQHTAGNLEFNRASQQLYQSWKPSATHLIQQLDDMTTEHDLGPHSVKPAVKPRPRSRYSRFGTSVNVQVPNQNAHNIDSPNVVNPNGEDTIPDIYELPPEVGIGTGTDNSRNTNARQLQMTQDVVSKNFNQQTGSTGYDIEGGNVDQVNLLHKSNDATVGLQWHYTYHPSDQRQFVQQTDQKNKEGLQQQSKIQFSNLEQNLNQEIQNKYTANNPHQQLELPKQSENYAFRPGIIPIKRTFNYDQTENKLIIDQQLGGNGDLEKYVTTSESEPKPIPRILETYGGGQYDPTIGDDIYSKVTINPSATLSSINNMDSWDIREKPEATTTANELTPPPLPVKPLDINVTTEAPHSSSFWSRVGHKITSTFGKAKEKAKNIFG
ncbi:hypothetical protein WN48_06531 [Eufriesea mexicana]|uniref:Uncharacterized protein n=1 Tax=Eufriesea mexicana TaxID=516756 RepID=A0A310SK50_9HYME|nr:hypothetical protein WN48_06531 [Eufriesea mexicana]